MRLDVTKRSTTDIVVLMLTVLICVVMVITVVGVTIIRIVHPELEVQRAAEAVNNMLSTIIGALVGFISGRAVGRREERQVLEENGNKQ